MRKINDNQITGIIICGIFVAFFSIMWLAFASLENQEIGSGSYTKMHERIAMKCPDLKPKFRSFMADNKITHRERSTLRSMCYDIELTKVKNGLDI